MYRINNKSDFSELAKCSSEYIMDMNDVFLDIHGGEPKEFTLKLRSPIKKK